MQSSNKQTIALITLLFITNSCVFADDSDDLEYAIHPYLGGTIGYSLASPGFKDAKIHYYDGLLTDAYHTNTDNKIRPVLLGANAGIEFQFADCARFVPSPGFGLGIYGTGVPYTFRGHVDEIPLDDPSSTLYKYKFNIRSSRFMFEGHLTWLSLYEELSPFISGGIGSAWNQMNQYKETPINESGYIAVPPFKSKTSVNFAYQIGLGIAYSFNYPIHLSQFQRDRLLFGYQYVSLGNASFSTRGASYPHKLDTGTLKSQEIYLTYIHLM